MRVAPAVGLLVLLAAVGCHTPAEPEPEPAPAPGGAPAPAPRPVGGGPYPHAAIRPTVGPACGAATELVLAADPIAGEPTGAHVRIGLNGFPEQWAWKAARFGGGGLRDGWASRWTGRDGDAGEGVRAAAVRFDRVVRDAAVEGEYDLTFPDGTTARGWFRAAWLPHPGEGG